MRQITSYISVILLLIIVFPSYLPVIAQETDLSQIMWEAKWSPDGQMIAVVNPEGKVQIYNSNGVLLREMLTSTTEVMWDVAWNTDNVRLATASLNSRIYIWDVSTGMLLDERVADHDAIIDLVWQPNSDILISGGVNDTYYHQTSTWNYERFTGGVSGLVWDASGDTLFAVSTNGILQSFDKVNFSLLQRYDSTDYTVRTSIDLSFDGSYLMISDIDGRLHLHDTDDFSSTSISATLPSSIGKIRAHPHMHLVALGTTNAVIIVNTLSGAVRAEYPTSTKAKVFDWSPDGTQLMYADGNEQIIVESVPIFAPSANAGTDQTIFTLNSTASVTLDGSESSDVDGSIVSYIWTDSTGAQVATGVSPTVDLPVGAHTLTLTVTDDDGATASDAVVITVEQDFAPSADAGPDQTVNTL